MGTFVLGPVLGALGSLADLLYNLMRLFFLLAHYFAEEKPRISEKDFSKVTEIETRKQTCGVCQQIRTVSNHCGPNVRFALLPLGLNT